MRRAAVAAAVLWLCVIWGNSLLPGESSSQVSGWAGQLLEKILPFLHLDTDTGMRILRKCAHFSEFAVLGLLLRVNFRLRGKPARGAVIWGVSVAVIDETIQRFVPDRYGCLTDVMIDSAGVITGAALFALLLRIASLRNKYRKKTAP